MVRLLVIAHLASAMLVAAAFADEKLPKELEVLDRSVGKWKVEMTIEPGPWVPQGAKTTGNAEVKWVLNNRFVRGEFEGTRIEGGVKQWTAVMWITTWDPQAQCYRGNVYYAVKGGDKDYWGGGHPGSVDTWDEKTQTMTGRAVDKDTGITSVGLTKWIDKDHYEWTNTVTDGDGNVMMVQKGKGQRIKD